MRSSANCRYGLTCPWNSGVNARRFSVVSLLTLALNRAFNEERVGGAKDPVNSSPRRIRCCLCCRFSPSCRCGALESRHRIRCRQDRRRCRRPAQYDPWEPDGAGHCAHRLARRAIHAGEGVRCRRDCHQHVVHAGGVVSSRSLLFCLWRICSVIKGDLVCSDNHFASCPT